MGFIFVFAERGELIETEKLMRITEIKYRIQTQWEELLEIVQSIWNVYLVLAEIFRIFYSSNDDKTIPKIQEFPSTRHRAAFPSELSCTFSF